MSRLVLVTLALAGAVIALLVWIASGALSRHDLEKELLDGGGRKLAGRPESAAGGIYVPPAGRPRGADHALLVMLWPKGAPEAARGGPEILSLRGNLVAFRRAGLDPGACRYERMLVPGPKVDALLDQALALAENPPADDGSAFLLRLDLGSGEKTRHATREQAASLLGGVTGRSSPGWVPPEVFLRLEEGGQEDGAVPWPEAPALGDMTRFTGEGATVKAPDAVTEELLERLCEGTVLAAGDRRCRVVAFDVTPP